MSEPQARFLLLVGHVQGVGFRPFVYRLASEFNIHGWVEHRLGQVAIHAEGGQDSLCLFVDALIDNAPPHATPVIRKSHPVALAHHDRFSIHSSESGKSQDIRIVPDLAVCGDCLKELFDPNNSRYRYPFINCTHCGPRYTLIRQLPYDRANTTMEGFPLCQQCQAEYQDPANRRFHAEPIACPHCGPSLLYVVDGSNIVRGNHESLAHCVQAFRKGLVVAVKGIGGYHLMCDARSDDAIARLRQRKARPDKPLAVMIGEAQLTKWVLFTAQQYRLLSDAIHPIVLLPPKQGNGLSKLIAPGLDEVGVMLPYSPLHHLLMEDFAGPLVATSANISGEPVLTQNTEVQKRLGQVADVYLHHNRPIQRPADDSVYRFIVDKARPIRLGRGNSPLELQLPITLEKPVVAVGGHMKNTIALAWDNRIVISPHIGELQSLRSQQVFEQVINDLQQLYRVKVEQVICDAHPSYSSTRWAVQSGLPVYPIFHHYAHAACVAGEFSHEDRWLVFTWDGVGFGHDATLWGGEALLGHPGQWQRVASIEPFYLPGGDRVAREPWRSAAALCWQADIPWDDVGTNTQLVHQAWRKKINCLQSSSIGRLFDAGAALVGLLHYASFEGQGPMLLEAAAVNGRSKAIPLSLNKNSAGVWCADWVPLLALLKDDSKSVARRARCFHETMAAVLLQQAQKIRNQHGDFAVGLSGGVFQNRLLTERVAALLCKHGFRCYIPEQLPVNDAGLSYGQVVEYGGLGKKG